jgi:predicted permease
MAHTDPEMLKNHGAWWLDIVARLKPGVTVERARAESDAIFQSFMADVETPASARTEHFDHIQLGSAAQGQDRLRKRFSQPLTALLILAGLALLAACINVANLMLARSTNRQREFAVRLAIGAGRERLIRQTLTEAAVLVFMGALLGIWIAHAGEAALASFFAEGNNKIIVDLTIDGRILLYTIAVSVLTGLTFGLLPAVRAARVDPACGLQGGSRAVAGSRSGMRLGRALVAAQVALAMVLIAGAGIFVHSLRAIQSIDLGFTRDGILTMVVAPERDWLGKAEWFAVQHDVLDRVQHIHGVRSASWSTFTPLNGRSSGVQMDTDPPSSLDPSHWNGSQVSVSPEYFDTFGIRVLNGRTFTARDDSTAPKVAILNQTAARLLFGGANPVRNRLTVPTNHGRAAYEIVGIVNDDRHRGLRAEPGSFVYFPIPQTIEPIDRLTLAVRISGGDPLSLAGAVRREVQSVHSTLLITNISTMEQQIALNLIRERLVSSLSVAFGLLALALTCIGLYGILAYSVARRTNEIGIRLALGATRADTVWMVLREALILAAAGVVIGTPFVWLLGRASQTLLYGVSAFDPLAVSASAAGLLAFAVAAGWIPARRASRLEPLAALRVD